MALTEAPYITVSRHGSMAEGKDARYTVIRVHGEQDIATKVPLVVAIARAARRDDADLLVDLSEVTFMDASTIGAIVASRNRLRSRSRSLEVRAPSPAARRVLDLCGLAHLVHSSAETVHPAGVAAALSTWVDIPSTQANRQIDLDADGTAPFDGLHPAEARWSGAATPVDVEQGAP